MFTGLKRVSPALWEVERWVYKLIVFAKPISFEKSGEQIWPHVYLSTCLCYITVLMYPARSCTGSGNTKYFHHLLLSGYIYACPVQIQSLPYPIHPLCLYICSEQKAALCWNIWNSAPSCRKDVFNLFLSPFKEFYMENIFRFGLLEDIRRAICAL